MKVSVRSLERNLAEYLDKVEGGERLVITRRGRPIAEVAPPSSRRPTPEQRLLLLAEAGEVRLPKGAPLDDLDPIRVRGRRVSATILDDRE